MAYEDALMTVNILQTNLAGLARAIADMLKDGKVTPWEGMALSMRAMNLASSVMMLLQGMTPESRADLLYVLEHAQWMVST